MQTIPFACQINKASRNFLEACATEMVLAKGRAHLPAAPERAVLLDHPLSPIVCLLNFDRRIAGLK